MQFAQLALAEPILRALITEGYITATPVQAAAIPPIMEGKDVLACAQTGTGKTAAFALPILHRLSAGQPAGPKDPKSHKARCLVLAPTRELATQIAQGFRAYGKHLGLRSTVIFGGVNQNPQADALRRGVDIIIATPGRLLDLMNQRLVNLSQIECFVLDEADRMLDMGFIHDIRKIGESVPPNRQTLLFSATMPNEIRKLTQTLMKDPVSVNIEPVKLTTELIEQSVYHVDKKNKPQLLAHLVKELPMYRTIVFTRTKHGADRLVRHLHHRGIKSEAIHGNKTQNARQRALDNFRANKIPVLVATDIASRGIDIDDISHVVNYDITHEPETYVHRIGRTGRAGAKGAAIAFCDRDEMSNLKAIERLLKKTIPVKTDHPVYSDAPVGPQDSRDQQQRPQQPSHLPHRRDRNEHREPHSRPASAPPRGAHRPHAEAGRGAGHSGPVAAQRGFSGKPRGAAAGGGKPKQFGKQRFGRAR